MNRRAFLQTSSALTATALTSTTGRTAPMNTRRMRVALVPGSIGVTVASQRESIDLARRHGFEAVEPRAPELAAASPGEVQA
ncbi:MAG: hypothetical protein RJB55_1464, partial [Verrucomicrobiota bacterium]